MVNKTLTKVIYIEDEDDIRTVVEIALLMGNFSTTLCSSGAEGLKLAQQLQPDLILIDVMMPEMDGPATLIALRNNPITKNIPVVFMTARSQKHEIEYFKSLGVVDVIVKPFNAMTLATEIETIWKNI